MHLGQHTANAPYVDPAVVWVADDDLRGSVEGGREEGREGGEVNRRVEVKGEKGKNSY